MSDEHDWVRRLLADAGQSPEPMPPDVAARLDRVLDELAEEPVPTSTAAATAAAPRAAGGVVPMTRRRHRRWAGALLAAAAITVGGYSLTATGLLDDISSGAGSQTAADSTEGGAVAPEREPSPQRELAEGGALARDRAAQAPAALSSATLRRDATLLVSDPTPTSARGTRGSAAQEDSREAPPISGNDSGCVPPPASLRGARVAVTYDGDPATAVVQRTSAGRAEVQVWDCASPVELARVTVPR